ncbi:tagaturonate epimerase family protein [Infirmifilum sp. SLHALR2]|nr:MAG: hypothetical protein B7L53_07500 [Thermofilum sp. NZ13]
MLRTPLYLGKTPHLAVGVRIPEVFLDGILNGFKDKSTAGGVMLSYHRETAPEYVINAPPGAYEITRGHTGTSIHRYIELSAAKAKEKGVAVEIEADHVSVTASATDAVRRITGGRAVTKLSDREVEKVLEYIRDEVREAASTRNIYFFTIDTCELINHAADQVTNDEVSTLFKDQVGDSSLLDKYLGVDVSLGGLRLKFDQLEVKRIALKLYRSVEVLERIYRIIREEVPWEFGVEVAFDETPNITDPKELYFILRETTERGVPVDFVAPNVGFQKREDYTGSLEELYDRVKVYSSISALFNVLLSFHSGSGRAPFSMKGPGVHDTIRRATGGLFKYKVSGVYFELLMRLMARHESSRVRRFFEEIYDEVLAFLEEQVRVRGELYDETLARLLEEHVRLSGIQGRYLVDTPLFRHYSFVALNLRRDGKRFIREGIVQLYEEEPEFKASVDREVRRLTSMLVESLGFTGNAALVRRNV